MAMPPLSIAVVLFTSVIAVAQTPGTGVRGAQLGAAAQHLQQGRVDETIRECRSVLAADPRSAPAHMLLGMAYVAKKSGAMIADAKAELQQALDLDPQLLWARFYLARLYLDQGLTEKAQQQLELGLKQQPGFPAFLSMLGEARRKLGDAGASVELNRRALEADATMSPAHYFLALAYVDMKQDDAAMAEFEKAIHSPAVTPEMYNSLASLYIRRQQFAPAEDLCRKAIAIDPSRPDPYLNLARIYNARHASDKALEALRAALPEGREFTVSGILSGTAGGYRGGAGRGVYRQKDVFSGNRCLRSRAEFRFSPRRRSPASGGIISEEGRHCPRGSAYKRSRPDRERPEIELGPQARHVSEVETSRTRFEQDVSYLTMQMKVWLLKVWLDNALSLA